MKRKSDEGKEIWNCLYCDAPLVRRPYESFQKWMERKHCNQQCSGKRENKPRRKSCRLIMTPKDASIIYRKD